MTTAKANPEQSAGEAVRPFRVDVPEDALVDLRRRINATRWPERETVPDQSQGVQLATIQAAAGVKLVCGKAHEHTDACSRYGFHDFRRTFATMNAEGMTAEAL